MSSVFSSVALVIPAVEDRDDIVPRRNRNCTNFYGSQTTKASLKSENQYYSKIDFFELLNDWTFLFPFAPAGYYCKCSALYIGTYCELSVNPCSSNPCLYGGTCIADNGDFVCHCRGLYTGQRSVEPSYCSQWKDETSYNAYVLYIGLHLFSVVLYSFAV